MYVEIHVDRDDGELEDVARHALQEVPAIMNVKVVSPAGEILFIR